jgi:uncharacterized protein (UPF0264 family)
MLISVKNATEARIAAAHPSVSVVDLKDPDAGSLGFAGPPLANGVIKTVSAIDPTKKISLACGELHQWRFGQEVSNDGFNATALADIHWEAVTFAKVGLSDQFDSAIRSEIDFDRWKRFFSRVPDHVQRVLVIYVDLFSITQAKAMIDKAASMGASVVLLDTFNKASGSTFAYYSPEECHAIFKQARSLEMMGVLAGSIELDCLPLTAKTSADLIGVRGAVCERNNSPVDEIRKNSLCQNRLDQFLTAARVVLDEERCVS